MTVNAIKKIHVLTKGLARGNAMQDLNRPGVSGDSLV